MTSKLPQKRYFRQRAHANPFSDHQLEYPIRPTDMEWAKYFSDLSVDTEGSNSLKSEEFSSNQIRKIEFADIGCGYGGLLVALSTLYPNVLMLGMEIRVKVADYVKRRIEALRLAHPGQYGNIAIIRTNTMKCMPHFFDKSQLSKMFFLFPDPHFKKKKHKARIISTTLLSEYAYFLKEGGWLYATTDVPKLFEWMVKHLEEHPLFKKVSESEYANDPIVQHVLHSTEEGRKVARNEGTKYIAIYRRVLDPIELN